MPPTRNTPLTKAVKTERTREENQERAYIAASRRSDRSLEARVESARRASQIHQRRSGRSLRVTELDVINEEMYEEEDDILPLQYRRLAAHLQTGSADFNRRLAAYLTSQVAMRSAMEQIVGNSYTAHQADMQHRPNLYTVFHSPTLIQDIPLTPLQFNSTAPLSSPSAYLTTPRYLDLRTYSIAGPSPIQGDDRLPVGTSRITILDSTHQAAPQENDPNDAQTDAECTRQTQSATLLHGQSSSTWQDIGPFTTTLPPESQQMLGPALDLNDPLTTQLMTGAEKYTKLAGYPWGELSGVFKGIPGNLSTWPSTSATLDSASL